MTWTYSGSPSSSNRDAVRFHIQDTDTTRQLLADEELDYLLAEWMPAYGDVLVPAAVAARTLAAKFAPVVNVSGDGVSVDQGSLFQKYKDLSVLLWDQYKDKYANVGPLLPDPFAMDNDPSIESLTFGIGHMDNYWAGQQDYGDRHTYSSTPVENDPSRW